MVLWFCQRWAWGSSPFYTHIKGEEGCLQYAGDKKYVPADESFLLVSIWENRKSTKTKLQKSSRFSSLPDIYCTGILVWKLKICLCNVFIQAPYGFWLPALEWFKKRYYCWNGIRYRLLPQEFTCRQTDRHTVVTNNMDDIQKTRASTTMYNVDLM